MGELKEKLTKEALCHDRALGKINPRKEGGGGSPEQENEIKAKRKREVCSKQDYGDDDQENRDTPEGPLFTRDRAVSKNKDDCSRLKRKSGEKSTKGEAGKSRRRPTQLGKETLHGDATQPGETDGKMTQKEGGRRRRVRVHSRAIGGSVY